MLNILAKRVRVGQLVQSSRMLGLVVVICSNLIFGLVSVYAASTYYVAATGSDSNNGTSISTPFLTIQKCANVAQAGDICNIRGGTYHETVTPSNSGSASSPIIFQPYNGESVTIDGADQVTGWSVYSGNIYRTSVALSTSLFDNQIFVDGQMMNLARWPNVGFDLLNETWARAANNSTSTLIYDSSLPNVNWNGAIIHTWAGTDPFMHQTGVVTSSSTGQISFSGADLGCPYVCMQSGGKYYLTGVLAALDTSNEWYYDTNYHFLYLWIGNGDNPANHVVKAKQRNYAFDLSNRSYIQITSFELFGNTILTNDSSTYNTIDGVSAKYLSHYSTLPKPPANVLAHTDGDFDLVASHEWDSGIIINGTNNVLRNSTLAYSAGNGVRLGGSSNTLTNNLIHDVDYMGSYAAGVAISGSNQVISHNTIYRTGRDGIEVDWHLAGTSFANNTIAYNDVFQAQKISIDGAEIYVCCLDGSGTSIDHNWTHDVQADPAFFSFTGAGIYLDNSSSSFLVHHNVSWNNAAGIFFNGNGGASKYNLVYNNTFGSNQSTSLKYSASDTTGVRIVNNIYSQSSDAPGGGAYIANNLPPITNPLFIDTTTNNYHLQSSSPAKDAGQPISNITDGYVGSAPDQGAYELDGTDWIAGCNFSGCSFLTIDDSTQGSGQNQFNYSGSGWQHCFSGCGGPSYYSGSVSYSNKVNDQLLFTFNATSIRLYGAKWSNAGILAVSIDGASETNLDLYAPSPTQPEQLIWSSPVLSSANHTLKVRVTGTKNAASSDTYVPIDKIEIDGVIATTSSSSSTSIVDDSIQGSGPNQFNYTGTGWHYCAGSCGGIAYYNSTVSYSNVTNDQVTFAFSGIVVQLYAGKWDAGGIAAVSVDGGAETTVDLYASPSLPDQLVWSSPVLSSGNHVLKVRVTGTKNISSNNTFVPIDRIDVIQSGLVSTVDDSIQGANPNQFNYTGSGWQHCAGSCGGSAYYNSSVSYDNVTNDQITFAFNGIFIQLYAGEWDAGGIAAVSVDGGAETTVDLYASPSRPDQLRWSSPILALGSHTLKVRVTGTKNGSSSNTFVPIDRVNFVH